MLDEPIAFLHLHFGDADAATAAPRHHVVAAVDHAAIVALLQEAPDGEIVFLGHREVRLPLVRALGPIFIAAVPVHPEAEADRLFRLHAGKAIDAVLALLHEAIHRRFDVARHQVLDVALALEAEFLLDLDLDPEALAIEPLLVAEFVAGHGEVAVVGVLISSTPGMMHAHRIIGSDRPIEKRPARLALVLGLELFERANALPEGEHGALELGEVGLGINLLERHVRATSAG